MKPIVVLLVFCALSIPAFSASVPYGSGNDFLAGCSALEKESTLTESEMVKNMQCLAYLRGLIDGAYYEIALSETEGKARAQALPFCRPEGAGDVQLVRVALKYVRDNPEKAHLGAGVLVLTALRNAFPCSK